MEGLLRSSFAPFGFAKKYGQQTLWLAIRSLYKKMVEVELI